MQSFLLRKLVLFICKALNVAFIVRFTATRKWPSFEKVADENTFHETTPNHGFLFPKKVQNDVKERRKENQERGEGKRTRQPFFYMAAFAHS